MKFKRWAGSLVLVLLISNVSSAQVVVAGDDFDMGTTNGGFVPTSRTLNPDNTMWNGRFGEFGSSRDRFGLTSIDPEGDGSCAANINDCGLEAIAVDHSLGIEPGDPSGIIPVSQTDLKFVIADLENSGNPNSPFAFGTWEFDIAGHNNLQLGIDMAMIGDFGAEDRGGGKVVTDQFVFSYSIDGGASQPLFNVTPVSDNAAYKVVMGDGGEHLTGEPNFFYDQFFWDALGCVPGTANSCADEVDVFGDGSTVVRPDAQDINRDGYIYIDLANTQFTDDPINPGNLEEGKLSIYEDTNSFGTFSEPEFQQFKNALLENGTPLGNQLSQFLGDISGTGDVLTLSFEAQQYGGARYFVFDNIVVQSVEGMVSGDFNSDKLWDCADIDALVAEIVAGTNNADFDMNGDGVVNLADIREASLGWLAVGGANNPDATGGNAFLVGDATLDGVVDGLDFIEWNENKFTSNAAWCSGDFNADGIVDGLDFIDWNENKFTSSNPSLVPEPGSMGLIMVGLMALFSFRRRR